MKRRKDKFSVRSTFKNLVLTYQTHRVSIKKYQLVDAVGLHRDTIAVY